LVNPLLARCKAVEEPIVPPPPTMRIASPLEASAPEESRVMA
jgi:hypothetical protein